MSSFPSARARPSGGPEPEATTAALLAAARHLFAARGYAAVRTDEVVGQAGVTGPLEHHFRGGKEALFRAVLIELSAETVRQVARAAIGTEDPWEALVAGADAVLDACATPEFQRIVLIDGPSVLGWDIWRALSTDLGLRRLEQALGRAIDAGATLPAPPGAVAHVLAAELEDAATIIARAEDPAAARAVTGQAVRRLLDGLRASA